MLNILAGKLKALKLKVPQKGTRPTHVMLRRKMFDRFFDWEQIEFIDLCAGSGAMGLEAISRGAQTAIFIEKARPAYELLKSNIAKAKSRLADESLQVVMGSFLKFLASFHFNQNQVLYFDPPYEELELYQKLAKFIEEKPECRSAQWWIESDSKKGYSLEQIQQLFSLEMVKAYHHGDKFIAIMQGEKE